MRKKTVKRKSKLDEKSKKAVKLINKLTKEMSSLSKSEYKKVSKDLIRLTGRKPVKMNKKALKRKKVKKGNSKTKKAKRGKVKSGSAMSGQNMGVERSNVPGQPMPVQDQRTFMGMDSKDLKERIGLNIIDGVTFGSGFIALEALYNLS